MESLKQVITEVRALQAVVGVLARTKSAEEPEFLQQVIDLVNHMAKDLTHREGDDLRIAAQQLIDQ